MSKMGVQSEEGEYHDAGEVLGTNGHTIVALLDEMKKKRDQLGADKVHVDSGSWSIIIGGTIRIMTALI